MVVPGGAKLGMSRRKTKPAGGTGRPATRRAGAGKGRKRKATGAKPRRRLLLRLLAAIPGILTGLLLLWAAGFYLFVPELPDTDELIASSRQARVTLLTADGGILAERGVSGAPYVRLGEISPWLVKAVLATEDRRFYHHFGLDIPGTARALLRNLLSGSYVAGGSTITQQLAKNLYLTPERSILRKIRELFLALWLEARLSKDQILELYLNRVYFGAGAWGVEAASRTYFDKPARELDLAEAAMLAGLLKAPSRYAPTRDLARARARAATVLGLMVDAGYIDAAAAERARNDPAGLAPEGGSFAAYFTDWVLERLTRFLGKPEGDLVIRTTLDAKLQRAVDRSIARHLAKRPRLQAAVVVLDATGAVRALSGGRSYRASRFNRAVASRRQPGSAFKPFVYAAAFARGYGPQSVIDDRPFAIGDWRPRNAGGHYYGRITLERAFARSVNSVAVRLAYEIGPEKVARLARRMGITSELRAVPSLALGTSELSPFELASAYLPFLTGGIRRPPFAVSRVADTDGGVLYRHVPTEIRVLSPQVAASMRSLLRAAVDDGTGRKARLEDRIVFGKTGTTQNGRDGWFVGFSGRHLIAVWVGRDDDRPVKGLIGGGLPARIWRDIMRSIPAEREVAAAATTTRAGGGEREESGLAQLLDWLGELVAR